MSKYLLRARYTSEGWRGLVKEGVAARMSYVRNLVESSGGTLESLYFVYGEDDLLFIVDVDQPTVAGLSMAVNQTESAEISTTPLLTVDEMEEARGHIPDYRPPGH
jgi:uncharacterized protein with GYD domain